MKKLKKIKILILTAILAIGLFSITNIANASTTKTLGITGFRSTGYKYHQGEGETSATKTIWKILEYNSSGTPINTDSLIYCIKGGAGFGSESDTTEDRTYQYVASLKDKSDISGNYATILSDVLTNTTNYNKLIWIIDHMYTEIGTGSTNRNNFLKSIIPNEFYENLTDDDIDVIQQMAIWYYTNPSGEYHFTSSDLCIASEDTPTTFQTFSDWNTNEQYTSTGNDSGETIGEARQDAAEALYQYYITNASATYTSTSLTGAPVTLTKSSATMQTVSSNYIAGPYKLTENSGYTDLDYTLTASYKNYGTSTTITPTVVVKDTSGNYVTTTKTLKELAEAGTEFYLEMPTSTSDFNGIDMMITYSYSSRTADYWSVANAPDTEQPVVIINNSTISNTLEATIVVPSTFDLSLRKFITAVNGVAPTTSREPVVDTSALKAGTSTTATYNHTKNPIRLQVGDIVTYTIRVYNEGAVDGYVTQITDHLPANLEYIVDDAINEQYMWAISKTTDTHVDSVTTAYLSYDNETTTGGNEIGKYSGGDTLNYKDVQIRCRVIATDSMPDKITNIADITGFTDGNKNTVVDRDSQETNVTLPTNNTYTTGDDKDTCWPTYKDAEISRGETYIPGQQDDDDFEKVELKAFDLSLRKFITNVDGTEVTTRIPKVDISALAAGTSTTATYNHPKTTVKVELGSTVTYTIRVYNEGEIDGYASEITDHLPSQLQFLSEDTTNKTYKWIMYDSTGAVTTDETKAVTIKTSYLSKTSETTTGANELAAFDGTKLSYKDIKVVCKVVSTTPMVSKITNIADISAATDATGASVTDRDSQTNNVTIPADLPGYKDSETTNSYVPGQQDDDDFEKLEIGEFDLALKKFITAVNTTEITTRIPSVDVSALAAGTSTTATYTYPQVSPEKDPVLVSNGNIVTYTIRIYNEGNINGYASLIKDDIPEGLEFVTDNETNTTYRWVMLDSNGEETTDASKAVTIETDYLSKEQGEARMKTDTTITTNPSLINAFDGTTLSYKDIKVAFKVTESNTSDRIVINNAQISEDKDENGKDVTDRDSTPDKWVDGEDDQDIEKVKVQYFDLALRKWVTQAIVNDNGTETVTETGHTAEDDPEAIVKVDLKKSKLNTVTVKFRYKIRVTNQGQIAGYAKEIKDYIPDGLEFVAEDNPLWTQVDDKTITTDQAKDTLLQPGESTEVEVLLTWINGNDNLGLQDNWAEISKDYNEFNSPDIDSTPDNKKEGEDDIDDAPVILSVQTGQAQRYITISGAVLIIVAAGIILIKKFVI